MLLKSYQKSGEKWVKNRAFINTVSDTNRFQQKNPAFTPRLSTSFQPQRRVVRIDNF